MVERTIPKIRMHTFDNRVHEGVVYRIGSFKIYNVIGKYNAIDHSYIMIFA